MTLLHFGYKAVFKILQDTCRFKIAVINFEPALFMSHNWYCNKRTSLELVPNKRFHCFVLR